jgi:hypothetical protein
VSGTNGTFLVPKLCLGTQFSEALLRDVLAGIARALTASWKTEIPTFLIKTLTQRFPWLPCQASHHPDKNGVAENRSGASRRCVPKQSLGTRERAAAAFLAVRLVELCS